MRDSEAETYYEVEIMLGNIDESHIIRTIEYWDIERQQRPQFDHQAVIVAEKITSRFFNVIRLLNRAVPLIAVQLSAFRLDDNTIGLHSTTVLNVIEETVDADFVDQVERTDRTFWEKKADAKSLEVMDRIVASLRSDGIDPRITYNRHHIAMGTTGYNFAWLYPRKTAGTCHITFRAGEGRDQVLSALQTAGIDASPSRTENIAFGVTANSFEQHATAIRDALRDAEARSRH
jgi:hypothetical protein